MEISYLPDKELEIKFIKLFAELGRMDERRDRKHKYQREVT